MRIVIVGAGLGGLVAALSLRKRGFSVQVLEQSSTLGEIGAGIQTAPNASKILFQLGLRDHLESIHTEPQDQVRRRWRDGSIVASTPLGKELQHRFGAPYWHYPRADLHKLLVEQCVDPNGPGEPVEIFTSTRVVAVHDDDPAQPAVSSLDGRRFSGDLVIGADGIKSKVRDLIGAPDTLRFSGEMAYRVLIPGELIRADPATRFLVDRFHSTIWYGPDRHLVHYMISGGDILNLVAIVPATAGIDADWVRKVPRSELVAAFAEWDDRVGSILAKAPESVQVFAMYHRAPDPRWVYGRVALLGDACHAMLPYQAQGASQAMEDAAVLAEELGRVALDDIDGALARYVSRRSTRAAMVQDASLANKDFYHLPDGPQQQQRDRALGDFTGESLVSYDWLWSGGALDSQTDMMPARYSFHSGGKS